MLATCPICRSSDTRNMARFRHENQIFSGCSLVVCGHCEMIFASPMPSEAELMAYNANYFAIAHGGRPSNKLATAFFTGIARIRHAHVRHFLESRRISVNKVLEIGPGPGFFANSWLRDAPRNKYFVVETDKSCHQILEQMGVEIVNLAELPSVDLVVMSHVLEHVPDPVAFVQTVTRGLKSGGALFIEVPCRDWDHKSLDEPHILFFDKGSLGRLLGDLGFEDLEIGYYGQTISQLKSQTRLQLFLGKARNKLISWGVVAPFAGSSKGLDAVDDPLQRAIMRPYKAHLESTEPSWWLRAVARKI